MIKNADGSISGCHASESDANKQMAALYAQEPMMSENSLRYVVSPLADVSVRDAQGSYDNTWTMEGYAAVFNETTTLLDSKFAKLTESIDTRAFDGVLRDQGLDTPGGVVHFNFGHDMNRAVAASDVPPGTPGSLVLEAHDRGLWFSARVSRDDPDGQAMAVKMRDGVLRQASFAFTIGSSDYQESDPDEETRSEHRTITDVSHLYDVCATAQGAYSTTVAGLRSYGSALDFPVRPDLGSGSDVRPGEGSIAAGHGLDWPDLRESYFKHRPIVTAGIERNDSDGGSTAGPA